MSDFVHIGCAGWAIPKAHSHLFPSAGSHLERYAALFPAVEINSSFYKPHQESTYARWASAVPEGFRFSVKVPKTLTHVGRLRDIAPLDGFLAASQGLKEKRGPLLVQLPPSLSFEEQVAAAFFAALRERFPGQVVCEPRHPSWFAPAAEQLLARFRVARVAADPAPVPAGAEPGGWNGLAYYRLHGSPEVYRSPYSEEFLDELARKLATSARSRPTWCIFDNTASGAAILNAFSLLQRLR